MQDSLHFNSQFLLSYHSHFLKGDKTKIHAQIRKFSLKSPTFHISLPLSHRPGIQISLPLSQRPGIQSVVVVCAKRKKRRSGSQRTIRFMIKFMSLVATNLKILPQPLDLVVTELWGADGGGRRIGFWRCFGGDWGRFDGWRKGRKWKKMPLFWAVFGISSLCVLFGKEIRSDVLLLVLGFGILVGGFALIKKMKMSGFRNWVFGFCCFGAFLSLDLKKGNLIRWVEEIRVCSSVMGITRRRK